MQINYNQYNHLHCRCMNLGKTCPNNHFSDCKICPTKSSTTQPTEQWETDFDSIYPVYPLGGADAFYFEKQNKFRQMIKSFIRTELTAAEQRGYERGKAEEKEVCICAAVKTDDGKIIVRGNRHHNCLQDLHERKLTHGEQGFITSKGRFVTRLEGRRLQDAAGIKSVSPDGYQGNTLYSEDLY